MKRLADNFGTVPLVLLADHALLLSAPQDDPCTGGTLVVADLHLGKAATFRARGLPVPQGTTGATLRRLAALLAATGARRLVVLGDFLHAREAHAPATLAALRAWRATHAALEIVLVEGNHDRHAGSLPAELRVRVEQEPWNAAQGLLLSHHPRARAGFTVLAGHLHPCVRLYGGVGDSVRLPCFWWTPDPSGRGGLMRLPAFGEFTGGVPIRRATGDRVIAVGPDRLYELPAPQRALA